MVFITGDIHGDPSRFSIDEFPTQNEMTKEDYVIICGDFGMLWSLNENKKENERLDWLNNRNFTTLFVDGNHENFDRLNSYPVKEWHGGKVHFIRNSIIHLMRGEIYDINGSSFFAFGGARSHDIRGFATFEETKKDYTAGILQPNDPHFIGKLSLANRYGISVRVEGETWWRAELPTKNEMEYGISNLKKHHNKVDYIITHDGPISDLILVSDRHITSDPVNQYFEKVKQHTKYKGWYFGHHHMDKDVNRTEHAIYERIVQIM